MRISDHYQPFLLPTIVVLVGNDSARFLFGEERELNEHLQINNSSNASLPQSEEVDKSLIDLYKKTVEQMKKEVKKNDRLRFWVAVPEINKALLLSLFSKELELRIDRIISKNLVAMDLNQIARIISEG